jgi:uncharacterized spore protein YtfJ
MESNLNSSFETLFGKMENFVSTKTVVGDPIHIDGVIIVPLVEVAFGLGAGAYDRSEFSSGGGGLGGKITPTAILVVHGDTVQLVSVKNEDSVKKLIDMVPGVITKLNLGSLFSKKKDKASENSEECGCGSYENSGEPAPKVEFEESTVSEPLSAPDEKTIEG